jgi:uncharacterized protein (TIGR02246 family)
MVRNKERVVHKQVVLMLLLVVALAACRQDRRIDDLSPADLAAIRATTDRWVAAVRTGQWEEAAAAFTEDAILTFSGTPYEGRAAILKFHQAMPPWNPTRTLHIDDIRGRGDMAFVAGHSTIVPDGGGSPVVVGRYLDIRLRQADGTWLFYRDMVSPISPAPVNRE